MSDFKRSSLGTVSSSKTNESVNDANKKVIRLNLVLSEPNKEWCPVFNYEVLVRQAQDKKDALAESLWSRNHNGSLLPFSDDDTESMRRLAKQLEERYGANEKRKRCQTYTELGAGYDENDSFIDNTEACEEGLHEEVEKKHEGYYINCERFDRLCTSDLSDHEENRYKTKRAIKRTVELSDDDGSLEEKHKKTKLAPEVRDTSEGSETNIQVQNIPMRETQKKNETKKSKPVKLHSEEKRNNDVSTLNTKSSGCNPLPAEIKKSTDDHKSVNDIIESVINAVHSDNESSRDSHFSTASGPPSGSNISSESDASNSGGKSINLAENPPVLPEGLSREVKTIIDDLILAGTVPKESSDKKFFSPSINSLILRLEYSCRYEMSPSVRNMVYTHLAHYLPFSKATLITRGKKLVLGEVDSKIEPLIFQLKSVIESIMPRLQEGYAHKKSLCIKSSQIKPMDKSISSGYNENNCAKSPSKIFTWNESSRNYLNKIVRLKVRQFKISHGRKLTLDVYINNFLTDKLLPIWPKGWMTTSLLSKQCSQAVYEEAKLINITVSNSTKKIPPPSDVTGAKSKTVEKSSPDSGHSSDYISSAIISEFVKKETSNSLNLPNINSDKVNDFICVNQQSKVPLKKKKSRTGLAKDDPILDLNDKPNQIDFNKDKNIHDSTVLSMKTENITNKDAMPQLLQKVPTSGPMSLKHRILQISAKDNDHKLKLNHKKSGDSSINWSNGVDNKKDGEHLNEKPNSTSTKSEEFVPVDNNNTSMSPTEMERRMHEETTAATDILSQLITDQNSLSQNVTGCGADDKVQMQLNEVMQDLVVLNQMSADTIDTLETNKDDLQTMQGMTSFQEGFYSHIRKEAVRQQISEHILYDDIPGKDSQTSHFTTQNSIIAQNMKHQTVLQPSQLTSTGASSSQHK